MERRAAVEEAAVRTTRKKKLKHGKQGDADCGKRRDAGDGGRSIKED